MKTLKILIAVRHGSGWEGGLDSSGRIQIHNLAVRLKSLTEQHRSFFLLSSNTGRTLETSEILAEAFGIEPRICRELIGDEFSDGAKQLEAVSRMYAEQEVVILVTHYEAPSGILNAFLKQRGKKGCPRQTSDKGRGLMLECVTSKIRPV